MSAADPVRVLAQLQIERTRLVAENAGVATALRRARKTQVAVAALIDRQHTELRTLTDDELERVGMHSAAEVR